MSRRHKVHVLVIVVLLLLLTLLLGGCLRAMGPQWHLVIHSTDWEPDHSPERQVCEGGMSASVAVGDVLTLRGTALAIDSPRRLAAIHGGAVRIGDSVTIEATCTGTDGTVIGYARVEGNVTTPRHSAYGGDTWIHPPPEPGHEPQEWDFCLQPTDTRGQPPCITEPMVAPI